MSSLERSPLQNGIILLLLAAAYWLGAYFVADFSGGTGAHWATSLQQLAGLPPHAAPVFLSLIGALGLLIIALPLAGILATLSPRHAAACALLVAIPATVSLLSDVYVLYSIGLQIPTPAFELIAFDAIKTLLIPPLLALAARYWMPTRPQLQ